MQLWPTASADEEGIAEEGITVEGIAVDGAAVDGAAEDGTGVDGTDAPSPLESTPRAVEEVQGDQGVGSTAGAATPAPAAVSDVGANLERVKLEGGAERETDHAGGEEAASTQPEASETELAETEGSETEAAAAQAAVDWANDPLGLAQAISIPSIGALTSTGAKEGADTSLWMEIDRDGQLPPGILPSVWVGADRFGRSKGIGIVSARTATEAQELVRLLDGSELLGRTLQVRHDQTKAQAQAIGLPQFRPAWLKRLGGAEPPIEGASAADTTGKAW